MADAEREPAAGAARTAALALPPPAPAPVHKDWDVSQATVSVVEVTTSSAISVAKIRAGVRVSPLQACYQDALRAEGDPRQRRGVAAHPAST